MMNEKKRDLVSPLMEDGIPEAGHRVRQVSPEYEGTLVYHSLYLPDNWQPTHLRKPGKVYPIIVEYTGNQWAPSGSTGLVEDANLGYGLSCGRDFIWVVMAYVEKGKLENAPFWWGDRQATIDYCKINLPRICDQFGGDSENIFLCGFSRGAIAASYIGLADEEIASFWKGLITHDHFDGEKEWDYPECDRSSAIKRLSRLKGRPVLVCGTKASQTRDCYLNNHLNLAKFTFLDVPVEQIFTIPEGKVVHPHTDLWMHRESIYRDQVRMWLFNLLSHP